MAPFRLNGSILLLVNTTGLYPNNFLKDLMHLITIIKNYNDNIIIVLTITWSIIV